MSSRYNLRSRNSKTVIIPSSPKKSSSSSKPSSPKKSSSSKSSSSSNSSSSSKSSFSLKKPQSLSPSPQTLVKSSKSPNTTDNINDSKIFFKKKSTYVKFNKKFDKLNKEECINLINEINDKFIESLPKTSKKEIKFTNPLTGKKINYDSEIVQQVLSKCYDIGDNNMKNNILKITDKEYLIEFPQKFKKEVYIQMYDDLKNNKITIDDILNKTTYFNNFEKSILLDYKISCDNINKNNKINFNEYTKHVLKQIIYILYNLVLNIQIDDIKISFCLFDDNSLKNYNENNTDYKCSIYDICNCKYNKININSIQTNNSNVLLNTILNKIFIVTIIKKNGDIFFDPYNEDNEKNYVKVDLNDNNTFKTLHDIYISNFLKYNTILPKYYFLKYIKIPTGTNLAKNTHLVIQNDLFSILTILNVFSSELKNNYDIITNNLKIYDDILKEFIKYDNNDHLINKLVYILINNAYYSKKTSFDYYYYFKFDGPYPSMSVMNYNEFFKLKEYQPLDIDTYILYNIERAYKGVSPLFSRDLNQGLQNFILNDIELEQSITKRLIDMFEFTKYKFLSSYNKDDIYVFHGAKNIIHNQSDYQMHLLSFLSCTFNIYTALDYGTSQPNIRDFNKKGIVYIFKINKYIKYINFNDALYQIILLPGAKILIKYELNISNIRYVFCEVKNSDKGDQYCIDLFKSIKLNATNPLYKITNYYISNAGIYPDNIKIYNMPACLRITNKFTRNLFRPNVPNIYIDTTNKYIYTSLGTVLNNSDINSFFNIQYTFHQLIINECYLKFRYNCIKYYIYCNANNTEPSIYTAWKYDNNYDTTIGKIFNYNIDSFFIDCLMSNIDCFNNRNYLQNTQNPSENILVWFKGCGLYNTSGIRKIKFTINDEPIEHITLLSELQNVKTLFMNKDIIEQYYDKFINKIQNFKEFLLKELKPSFIRFLKKYMTGLINSSVETQEYKDLEKMIDNLLNILIYRYDFYRNNKDKIINNIHKECKQDVITGGREILTEKTEYNNINIVNNKNILTEKTEYNNINIVNNKNILTEKTEYNNINIVNNKKILDLNDIKNIPIGNEPYDSYFVSKKDFDIITNKIKIRAKNKILQSSTSKKTLLKNSSSKSSKV